MRKYLLLTLFSLSSVCIFAQSGRKFSNEFLSLGVGSRAFGMSNAFIASVNDVTAGYWNPAGLADMDSRQQVSLMHAEYFAGIAKYDYAGFATDVDNVGTVGISIIRFGVDDIPDTSELIDANGNVNYDKIKSFSAADYAILLSFARNVGDREYDENGLSYGANAKIIHRRIGEYGKSFGFGLDVGIQYTLNSFKFAAVARDITTTFNAWSYNPDKFSDIFTQTGNEIPENSTETTLPKVILGAAYRAYFNNNFSLLTEVNFDISTDGKRNTLISGDPFSIDPHLGLEANYKNIVYVRGGVGNIQRVKDFDGTESYTFQPNIGLGLRIKGINIDYALTDVGNASDALYSNIFSLRLDLKKKD